MDYETFGKLVDNEQDMQILEALAATESEQEAMMLFDMLTPEQQDYVERLLDDAATDLPSETVTVEDKDKDGDLDKATIKSDKDGDGETDEVSSEEIIDDNDKEEDDKEDDVKVTDNGYKLSDERYKNILNTLRDRLF